MKASKSPLRKTSFISTGMAPLDSIMGGGVPMRRITQFSGAPGTGKTTTAYMCASEAQKRGLKVYWYDTEKRFDFDFAEALGINLSQLELETHDHAEDIFQSMVDKAEEDDVFLVLDSVGGLHTRKEASSLDVGYPDAPKLIPVFIRHLVVPLSMHNSAALLLNHEKITFDGKLKVLGGEAIPFHSTNWVRFRRTTKKIMQGEKEIATGIEAKMWKGKFFHQTCELIQKYTGGFDMELMLADNAIEAGVIVKEKTSYYLDGEKLCTGLGNLRDMFTDKDFAAKIQERLNGTSGT